MIYNCIRAESKRLNCVILALGGLADHVHLVVEPPAMRGPGQIVQQIKGVSSRFANEEGIAFKWQAGYSAFSLSRPHLKAVIPYVQNQKQRHIDNNIWSDWEPSDD